MFWLRELLSNQKMSNVSSFSNLITSDPGRSWSSIKKWIGFIRNKKLAFKNSLIKNYRSFRNFIENIRIEDQYIFWSAESVGKKQTKFSH